MSDVVKRINTEIQRAEAHRDALCAAIEAARAVHATVEAALAAARAEGYAAGQEDMRERSEDAVMAGWPEGVDGCEAVCDAIRALPITPMPEQEAENG